MKNIIGVKTNCYLGFNKIETFDGLKNSKFKYLELSATPNCNTEISRFSNFSSLCILKEKLIKDHLKPIALGGHTNIVGKETTTDLINNLYLAKFFNCKYFVTNIGVSNNDNSYISEEEIVNRIKNIIPYLRRLHLILVIELHGKYCTGKSLINILKKVNSELVKINYDTGNAIYFGNLSVVEMLEDFENCIEYVGYMHLKDKLGENNEWNFPSLGSGKVPFNKIFEILNKYHNYCPLIIEIEFTPDGVKDINEVHKALKDSSDYLNNIKRK